MAASPSTTKRPVPPSGSRALTTRVSARAPCTTGSLVPLRLHEPPSSVAVTAEAVGAQREPGSSWAKASSRSPEASEPRSSLRCSALPQACTRPPASTTAVT